MVELNNMDVVEARALFGENRNMLQIVLNQLAARRLLQITRDYAGARLAIFIDDELIAAPPIYGADTSGELRIVGDFSRRKLDRFVAALNTHAQP